MPSGLSQRRHASLKLIYKAHTNVIRGKRSSGLPPCTSDSRPLAARDKLKIFLENDSLQSPRTRFGRVDNGAKCNLWLCDVCLPEI